MTSKALLHEQGLHLHGEKSFGGVRPGLGEQWNYPKKDEFGEMVVSAVNHGLLIAPAQCYQFCVHSDSHNTVPALAIRVAHSDEATSKGW